MKWFKAEQVLTLLSELGITSSKQVLQRWIRRGDITARVVNGGRGKGGRYYEISSYEIERFIESKQPAYFILKKEIINVLLVEDENPNVRLKKARKVLEEGISGGYRHGDSN